METKHETRKKEIRKSGGVKVLITEYPAVITATRQPSLLNRIFNEEPDPFEIRYWKKVQKSELTQSFGPPYINLIYDTTIVDEDERGIKREHLYYQGRFIARRRVTSVTMMGCGYTIDYEPLDKERIKKNRPLIKALEEKVGKILIELER